MKKKKSACLPSRHVFALTAIASLMTVCTASGATQRLVDNTAATNPAPLAAAPIVAMNAAATRAEPASEAPAPIHQLSPPPANDSKPNQTNEKKPTLAPSAASTETAEPAKTKPMIDSVVRRQPVVDSNGKITDVWDRVRMGMRFFDNTQIPGFENELAWFKNNTNYLNRVSVRARPYLFFIVEQLEARNMPTELALLPIIESAYQPMALSRSNAAGIWQFIPNTGDMYGLKQNSWYDGRRDVYASTRAALDLLRDINKGFNGDWQLTLAAYNAGAGTVSRAIKKNQAAGKPTDFGSLELPAETRSYVPRLIALANIVAYPEQFGSFFTPVPNEPFFTLVNVGTTIDLELAAAVAGISRQELDQLNPGFNRRATAPDGPHHLLIPKEKAAAFSKAIAELGEEERNPWINYKVAPGENLDSIASNHDTTPDTLSRINTLRTASVKPGDYVLIPRSANRASPAPSNVATTQDSAKRSVVALNKPGNPVNVTSDYQVRAGDTMWSIAKRMNVEIRDLLTWNNMQPGDPLVVGQKLALLTKSSAAVSTPAALTQKTIDTLKYIVRSGDTLFAIARKFQISVTDLLHWNNLSEGASIRPGQVLTLMGEAALRASKIH